MSSKLENLEKGKDYVILPLYGFKNKQKFVYEKSGLNQWNGKPRPTQVRRGLGEFYLKIPKEIHKRYSYFFPRRKTIFKLEIPNGETYNAKVCQQDSKALMTNPNKALSSWLLRETLKLKEGEKATIEKLNKLGYDSVAIIKENNESYKIEIMQTGSYDNFITK